MPMTERYTQVRAETERRCKGLSPEDMLPQPEEFVSPAKWHLGHSTWFFETFVLKPFMPGYREFDPSYNFLFNSYYEGIGERVRRNRRGLLFRPPADDIRAYRRYVDDAMKQWLPSADEAQLATVELGLQHEQQHQELLVTDTKYIFAQNPLLPVWDAEQTLDPYRRAEPLKWLNIPEGIYEIGSRPSDGFCFDNELGRHKQYIRGTEIMSRPVTNGEFLAFIRAGGYAEAKYWLSEGWEWVNTRQIRHPMYWYPEGGDFRFFHLDGLKPLDPQLPLMHISYYEADAYARWKGLSLPTEFEWEAAAQLHPQIFNDTGVWEWTGSAYLPYPGFAIAEGAVGEYNGKFMVNQLVLRGKSLATPEGHSRITYRNFFHAHHQWQFSGLRLVKK